jgi:hypothetical protein
MGESKVVALQLMVAITSNFLTKIISYITSYGLSEMNLMAGLWARPPVWELNVER